MGLNAIIHRVEYGYFMLTDLLVRAVQVLGKLAVGHKEAEDIDSDCTAGNCTEAAGRMAEADTQVEDIHTAGVVDTDRLRLHLDTSPAV